MNLKTKKGFSLIELFAVITALLAIFSLAGVGTTSQLFSIIQNHQTVNFSHAEGGFSAVGDALRNYVQLGGSGGISEGPFVLQSSLANVQNLGLSGGGVAINIDSGAIACSGQFRTSDGNCIA